MGIIPPNVHRMLDFIAVVAFALAPTLFSLHGNTMMLAYGLAVVHLAMTLATQFPGTAAGRPIPYHVHGMIELAVGVILAAVPFIRHWSFGAGRFFPAIGIVIIIIWALTRYRDSEVRATSAPVV